MTENLAEMVSGVEETNSNEESFLDLPIEEDNINIEEPIDEPVQSADDISITTLNLWFDKFNRNVPYINHVKVQIRGVDPSKTIIFSVEDPEGEPFEGNPARQLKIFQNADNIPVLDFTPESMIFINSGFMINYLVSDDFLITTYSIRNGLEITYSAKINDVFIPFYNERIKKNKVTGIKFPTFNIDNFKENIEKPLNVEDIQIHYRQIQKHIETITTKMDAINWLIERKNGVFDVNHLIQIDNVLSWLINE